MNAKFFLDTNILIYSFDSNSRVKQKIAAELIIKAIDTQKGMISYQVIQEFLNVATRKFHTPLTISDAKNYLEKVLVPLCHIYPTNDLYKKALDLAKSTGYSFYDALILASALAGNCKELFTEDLHNGHLVANLSIINPFIRKAQ